MRLTQKERAARRDAFRQMRPADKADYLWEYYKLPVVLGLTALCLLCSTVYRQLTKKEAVLYTAHINVSVGEDLESKLNGGFIAASGASPKKAEVYLYQGAYLSDDPSPENHEYGYASKLKLMAAIEAKKLDIVLMNREAYDIYSQNGYLLDLRRLFASDAVLYPLVEPYLTLNRVILEDNAIEYALHETPRYQAVTEEAVNGLDVSLFPLFREAGFPEPIYLGVVANSPRLDAVAEYIAYLAGPGDPM